MLQSQLDVPFVPSRYKPGSMPRTSTVTGSTNMAEMQKVRFHPTSETSIAPHEHKDFDLGSSNEIFRDARLVRKLRRKLAARYEAKTRAI